MQESIAEASWGKPTKPSWPANAYECTNADGARYKLEIEDQRAKYNVLTLEKYNAAVKAELQRITLNFSEDGSTVKWVRVEGVSGVTYSFVFGNYISHNLMFIKNGIVYRLEVGGDFDGKESYYQHFNQFVESIKMI
jgi:hypothetical protein